MNEDESRAQQRAMDPLYDQRAEMPSHELDGVDFFVRQPRRSPAPRPKVLAYFDSWLSQAELADRLDDVVAGMAAVLAETVSWQLSPCEAGWVLAGQPAVQLAWDGPARDGLAAALRTGQVEVATILLSTEDREHRWYLECWCHPGRDDVALSMSLSPTADLWSAQDTDPAAERVLALLESWRVALDLRTGGVTYDRTGSHRSPWDAWYMADHRTTAPLTRERVRGYFWANLLTEGQLARLGGLDAVRKEASERGLSVRSLSQRSPAERSLELAGSAAVLRPPGPPSTFDDEQLAAMKAVLAPVLIPKPYVLYQGYPLRIVPDPGTAFRRVPPGDPFPRLLP